VAVSLAAPLECVRSSWWLTGLGLDICLLAPADTNQEHTRSVAHGRALLITGHRRNCFYQIAHPFVLSGYSSTPSVGSHAPCVRKVLPSEKPNPDPNPPPQHKSSVLHGDDGRSQVFVMFFLSKGATCSEYASSLPARGNGVTGAGCNSSGP